MRVLEYEGLDTSRHTAAAARIRAALECDDFRAAGIKKLVNVRHGGATCAVLLDVIEKHAYERSGVATATILEAWQHLPAGVLRPERRRRAHLSSVLSRNEVDRDYACNRMLFKRIAHGWYQLNPALAIRRNAQLRDEQAAPPDSEDKKGG